MSQRELAGLSFIEEEDWGNREREVRLIELSFVVEYSSVRVLFCSDLAKLNVLGESCFRISSV